MTDKPNELYKYLLEKRQAQELDYSVSIMLNYSVKELKIKNVTTKNKNELIKLLESHEKKTDEEKIYEEKIEKIEKIKNPM